MISQRLTYVCTCGNAVFNKFDVYSLRNCEFEIVESGTAAGSNNGTVIWFVSTSWNIRASNMLCSLKPLLWSVSVRT